ncbi:hypothetical protein FHP88_15725 [Sedimenticola selenatireducens]|uniref:Uncharacterized protein n=1 Tax=Sedimenticola selenatireducens TaxID=191960 RepID=A0A557S0D9_9GAMM|nr:hypothetical protein [Sedimenticola selenatireducens]TVO70902.1 hypothetical protein FHP88_15725 [Sedimenticola selenatireducens]
MAEKKPTEEKQPSEAKSLTHAEVAKLVKREVPILDKETGKPTDKTREIAVKGDEVLSFKEYDDHVIVVTKDGKKLRGEK